MKSPENLSFSDINREYKSEILASNLLIFLAHKVMSEKLETNKILKFLWLYFEKKKELKNIFLSKEVTVMHVFRFKTTLKSSICPFLLMSINCHLELERNFANFRDIDVKNKLELVVGKKKRLPIAWFVYCQGRSLPGSIQKCRD